MAVLWKDGFDWYSTSSAAATQADMVSYYNGPVGLQNGVSYNTTQFNTGCLLIVNQNTSIASTFLTGTIETTIYGSVRVYYSSGSLGTSGNAFYITFTDGGSLTSAGTAQCTIRWNADGSIGLYTGGPAGTLIGSAYAGQYTFQQWNSWQFKIVINNTTGSIEIRKNGGGSNVITATSINTRGGTSNNYATGVQYGGNSLNTFWIDDLFVNSGSGTSPTTWPGDMRCVRQAPTSATQSQFTSSLSSTFSPTIVSNAGALTMSGNFGMYYKFMAPASGMLASLSFLVNANATANVKWALFDCTQSGFLPGAILATSNVVTNPTTAGSTATFGSPPTLIGGTNYWLGVDFDASVNFRYQPSVGYNASLAYSSFPTANPSSLSSGNFPYVVINITTNQSSAISDGTEDGDAGYIYSSTVGDEDKYALAPIGANYGIVAMSYYACVKKTDAGTRTVQLSVAANGSADTAIATIGATTGISTSYTYFQAIMPTDPTGAAWSPTTANGAIVGVSITA